MKESVQDREKFLHFDGFAGHFVSIIILKPHFLTSDDTGKPINFFSWGGGGGGGGGYQSLAAEHEETIVHMQPPKIVEVDPP